MLETRIRTAAAARPPDLSGRDSEPGIRKPAPAPSETGSERGAPDMSECNRTWRASREAGSDRNENR